MAHVSKIEIRGFKSFGNSKVTLPLSPGLTAIVGPNGSGKSNIFDAIYFVLGQMSAKTLRAERFSDLIFNGGKGQRQAPFAEVSLYFDNGDGALPVNSKVVIISRRADRTGKSVYRINKKRVSRQEIVEMLSKAVMSSGHNFIMQGDVDRFIKMDPISRRQIIDDIAGIAEYDEKREKALAELELVEANIKSASAVLNEIFGQMEKLRQEKESALLYKELKEKLEYSRALYLFVQRENFKVRQLKLDEKIDQENKKMFRLKERQKKLTGEIAEWERKVGEFDRIIEERGATEVIARAEKLRERISTLNEMIATTSQEYEFVRRGIEGIESQLKSLAEEGRRERGSLGELEGLLSKFDSLYDEFCSLLQKINSEAPEGAEAKVILGRMHELLQEIRQSMFEIISSIKNVVRGIESGRFELSGLKTASKYAEVQNRLASLDGQRLSLDKRLKELREKLAEAQLALEETAKQEKAMQSSISAFRKKREILLQRIHAHKRMEAELRDEIQVVEQSVHNYQIQRAELNAQLKAAEKEMRKVKEVKADVSRVNLEKLEREIEELESKLEALGPINFRAIQDFREAERRHGEQKEKCDKLLRERQKILDFIQEIDKKKTTIFMEEFEKISQNFSEIFAELSPGGSARLILQNVERPLEGGIEIEARPAGKEAVRVEAMSGGEKALTALAFIFAIQRARPSALYVLDEIDAHLDDVNLRRVANLLKRSSSRSQIVLITLKDAMMSFADRLFGVSMDENGVSHLVSVDLTNFAA